MTGLTYGGAYGGTYGTQDGGTYGTGYPTYEFNGQNVATLTGETATHRTLTLTWRVQTNILLDRLRTAKTDEGQISVLAMDDGGFTTVDRAGGKNTFHLSPPDRRQPLRKPGTYHVSRYEETLVSQSVDEWDVEIEFTRDTDRSDSPSITIREQVPDPEINSGGSYGEQSGLTYGGANGGTYGNSLGDDVPPEWWSIGTRYGTVATRRVDAEFLGTGADGVERFELAARFTKRQAHVFEAALSRLDGVRVREVTDGTNIAVDDTAGDANTVVVRSPTEEVVSSGEYVVMSWESERLNDAYQELRVEIGVKG